MKHCQFNRHSAAPLVLHKWGVRMSKAKCGRKSSYDEIILPRMDEIKEWIRCGKTDKDCAKLLGITAKTFSKYKNSISSFNSTIKENRAGCVENLENSMYDNAIGFVKTLQKPIKRKIVDYENGRKIHEEEVIEIVKEEIYIPPNVTAGIFLLKNWGGYTNEPKILEMKQKEFELKEKIIESNNFDIEGQT